MQINKKQRITEKYLDQLASVASEMGVSYISRGEGANDSVMRFFEKIRTRLGPEVWAVVAIKFEIKIEEERIRRFGGPPNILRGRHQALQKAYENLGFTPLHE